MDNVMKVKICGLRCLDDALAAAEAGADMLGFNFYQASRRYVAPRACATIIGDLRGRLLPLLTVGVFVNASLAEVTAVAAECDLDLIQLHGDEPPEMLQALGPRAFKAIRPASFADADSAMARYDTRARGPALLVDAFRPDLYGGTGATADWSLASALAARRPILLAGGLNPANVRAAIRQVRPWGVDTASGVESRPGQKDHAKMAAFVAAARNEEDVPC
jgi:phosphoribosylanthranilate isomerase